MTEPTKLTTIVLSVDGAIHSVRAHAGWMGDVEVDAYLAGIERARDGYGVVFNRITLYSDVGETDGGWVSAHWHKDHWRLAAGQ